MSSTMAPAGKAQPGGLDKFTCEIDKRRLGPVDCPPIYVSRERVAMRTLRVLLSLLVSAALIGVAAPLPVAAQPDSTPPNTGSGKVAGLSGYLLTEQGQPRSDRKVTLNALELLPNGDYVSRPIDSAITAANGRFELAADLRDRKSVV